ncbi:ABC transporter permease [Cytophagaceae bacterium ABcell3]|nr:ABC transporter permease [Cytophagaceae bacterium ABcell3]
MKFIKDFRLAASIAFTHMQAKLKQTIIATIGVTFGITVFIFMVSFITGTNQYMEDIAFEQSPHLRLYNETEIADKSILDHINPNALNIVHHMKPKDIMLNLKDGKQIAQDIKGDAQVEVVSASVNSQVFYRFGSSSINGMVNGIEFEKEDAMFNLSEKLVDGSFRELSTRPNSMVMGVGLAERLNVKTGDRIRVTTEKGNNFLVTVVGTFKTGLTEVDRRQSYANINTVQRFLNVPASYVTDIKVKLYDRELAPSISKELQKTYGFQGSDWRQDNAALLDGQGLRNMITYGTAITILLVAGFGIYNILTMMIYEKMKDIAILKAMGFSDSDIRWVFMTQALVIGAAGAIVGLLFGFLAAYGLSQVPFESDVMVTIDHMPVNFDIIFYITGFTFGIVTTTLSGFIPSRKAANVDPISILRG